MDCEGSQLPVYLALRTFPFSMMLGTAFFWGKNPTFFTCDFEAAGGTSIDS